MICAHMLVRNEERFLWYSVMSVIDYVDRIRLWDMGSTDNTYKIIERLLRTPQGKDKIYFKKIRHDSNFQQMRQEMLDATVGDWFLIVDGDEIWWKDSIRSVTDLIKLEGKKIESVVVPTVNVVGDIFHYQEKRAGSYRLAGKFGHFNLRGVNRNIPGLRSYGEHGKWGWVDGGGKMIQDRNPSRIKYINAPYIHATFLQRSSSLAKDREVYKRDIKRKYELGEKFPMDQYYPEVFFEKRPSIVPSVWDPMSKEYYIRARLETPFKKIKRRLFPAKIGY